MLSGSFSFSSISHSKRKSTACCHDTRKVGCQRITIGFLEVFFRDIINGRHCQQIPSRVCPRPIHQRLALLRVLLVLLQRVQHPICIKNGWLASQGRLERSSTFCPVAQALYKPATKEACQVFSKSKSNSLTIPFSK